MREGSCMFSRKLLFLVTILSSTLKLFFTDIFQCGLHSGKSHNNPGKKQVINEEYGNFKMKTESNTYHYQPSLARCQSLSIFQLN